MAGHIFINGGTMSGKTFLAQHLAKAYKAAGYGIIVLDPMDDPNWDADRQFHELEPFLDCAHQATGCVLFVDEAGQTVGRNPEPRTEWLATRARHWGHRVVFMGQDAVQVKPIIRDQCGELFLFQVSARKAELWADNFADPDLMQAPGLEKYQFINKRRHEPCKIQKLKA